MTSRVNNGHVVSYDDESLVLVDSDDREIGFCSKADVHKGDGLLHRAFSLFVFNSAGDLIIQKRAVNKQLWPGFWSNTCCSHPRRGESMEIATQRRLKEEIGIQAPLSFLFKFQYQARFGDIGAESELCWVYVGYSDEVPNFNSSEVSEIRYLSPERLDNEMSDNPDIFTPWFKMEWQRIRRDHSDVMENRGQNDY
ncbi:hypothetical protein L861_10610 [Litchfieldella anticariensis FP35 = DSM 16096]|uniref:Isopentenyl-diphosphate Delta-isomerase n=1 Tax=Litchfieldella anticariensis (strain DSM 16096 / CECT 5854 / CIP 108499 / LMG 22089 / FP35) TaxID=1121939 RepID=S2KGF5_LITA3|nr:isopentenyl-diphosphate Delta-isomerase [Halomonas anticariensis]EPC01015.1 hypothetical protein L861_10610 [Halomonas anticariensis FP35 = DSM 16096]